MPSKTDLRVYEISFSQHSVDRRDREEERNRIHYLTGQQPPDRVIYLETGPLLWRFIVAPTLLAIGCAFVLGLGAWALVELAAGGG